MRVAVVGAGLAGLAAADALTTAGIEPVVLEARDRVGGRVHSRTLENGVVVEMGAEFILPGCTETIGLAERLGLGLWDKGMRYGLREPRGVHVPEGAMDAAVAEIEAALGRGEGEGRHVGELLGRVDIDDGVRQAVLARAEVSAAASADEVPAAELGLLARVSDLPAPGIAGGNQRLAEALAAAIGPAAIQLRSPVRAITVGEDGVMVATDEDEVAVDFCIVAVPASVIEAITFDPPLSGPVAAALGAVTYGHAAKLFIPLGPGSVNAPPSATLAVGDRYWAWTATGDGPRVQPVISAFAGSPDALRGLGVAEGSEGWVEKLVELRGDLDLERDRALLSTWDDDPWVGAAYSVAIPEEADQLLARCHGRIGFAGEHLGGEMSALMEGAIRSGRRAAARVAESLESL